MPQERLARGRVEEFQFASIAMLKRVFRRFRIEIPCDMPGDSFPRVQGGFWTGSASSGSRAFRPMETKMVRSIVVTLVRSTNTVRGNVRIGGLAFGHLILDRRRSRFASNRCWRCKVGCVRYTHDIITSDRACTHSKRYYVVSYHHVKSTAFFSTICKSLRSFLASPRATTLYPPKED